MLDGIKNFIGQNWLSTTISIIAIIYAFYEARRARGAKLAYQFSGSRLIGSKHDRLPDGIQISFRGTSVTNLSRTQIVIWNKGDAPLRASDVPSHDPVRFSFGTEARVLLAEITKLTREVNKPSIEYQPGESDGLNFHFEFLDQRDGVLIEIWHNSDEAIPHSQGTILGQKAGPVSYGRFAIPRNVPPLQSNANTFEKVIYKVIRSRSINLLFIIMMMVGAVFLVVAGLASATKIIPKDAFGGSPFGEPLISVAMGSIYALTGLFFFWATKRRFPKSLTPDDQLAQRASPYPDTPIMDGGDKL